MPVPWLRILPIPLVSGSSNQESNNVARNDVEIGPPRFELLSEYGFATFSVTWLFNENQFRLFEGWWRHDILKGSMSFDMELKVGAGIKLHECYFSKPYKTSFVGKLAKVRATLLIVEKRYDSLADYNTLKAANP